MTDINELAETVRIMKRNQRELFERICELEAARGTPGAGTCICKASPEEREQNACRLHETWETQAKSSHPTLAYLDHRCPKHGEKAQPALWGRHKEKELPVSWAQWTSLGVKHE